MNVIEDKKYTKKGVLSVTETKTNIKTTVAQKRVLDSGDIEVKVQQYETESCTKNYHFHIWKILLTLIVIASLSLGIYYLINNYMKEETEQERTVANVINEEGFVFPDSNERYLTKEEVTALENNEEYSYQELLRYSINEIYARHGFLFEEEGKYWEYYNRFDWYSELEKKEVTYEMMNDFERKNISLLVEIEKEKGYRK